MLTPDKFPRTKAIVGRLRRQERVKSRFSFLSAEATALPVLGTQVVVLVLVNNVGHSSYSTFRSWGIMTCAHADEENELIWNLLLI
jgi:hypothetical protein